jgi:hypothetical protein
MTTDKKIYRLLPLQIPQFWEAIKFACENADGVKKEYMQQYFNELLQALLSDKAQCFIVLDEKRVLHSIAVTRVIIDKFFARKDLHIQCLYSLSKMPDEALMEYFNFISSYAKQEECKAVTYNSANPRIWEIAGAVSSIEQYRSFVYFLGGK